MNPKVKTAVLTIAFALFISAALFTYNALTKKIPSPNNINFIDNRNEVSENQNNKIKAPDFTVFDRNGNPVKLSDLFGKPIVLNFWASWCSPCRSEMPGFNEVYKEYGKDITFMMVDLTDGRREKKETGLKYVTEQGFSFPVYFDTEQDAANTYGIGSIPITIFIDKDGYIVTSVEGAVKKETLINLILLVKQVQ